MMINFLAIQVRLGKITLEQIEDAKGKEVRKQVESLLKSYSK